MDDYLISASIDQRITLLRWQINKEKIECSFITQMYTDIADVQGMDLIECDSDAITVCVFGKGMQVVSMSKVI